MVTLDGIVQKVKPFDGDISRRRDYERAKQGSELIETEQEKMKESLKAHTGFDMMNLPSGVEETEITKGDITFTIQSNKTTVKPQYKTAAVQMENYLKGRNFLAESEGRAITGMIKVQGRYFMDAESLRETFGVFAAGIMNPDVKHTISYDAPALESIDSIDLGDRNGYALTAKSFQEFVVIDSIGKNLADFVKAYEKELKKDDSEVTAVNTRAGYKKKESVSEGVDWAYVVKTLIQVRPKEELGELDIMVDPSTPLTEKRRQMPHFDMVYHTVNKGTRLEEKKVYVSLSSVYDRMQTLKDDKAIISVRPKIEQIDIV